MSHDLFISHSSGDAEVARALRAELEAAGYTCWLAPDDVVGNDPWAEQILAAISESRAMIVLISERASRSHHVSREVSLANGRNRVIVPIRIEPVAIAGSLEYHLEGLQRIDAFPPPITNHMGRILRRLALLLPQEAPAAAGAGLLVASDPASARTEVVTLAPTTPVGAAARTGWRDSRWIPPATGLSGALVMLAALAVMATSVLVLRPTGGSPSGPPATQSGMGSSSEPPATVPGPTDASTPSALVTVIPASPSPSATTVQPTAPDGPRTTPRPPAPKTPKPPTQPPATRRPPTPPPTQPPATATPVPATKPARITSHNNGSTIHGSTVTFTWSAATGPKSVRFYGLYVATTPPAQPCPTGYCEDPPDSPEASSDIALKGGMPATQHAVQVQGLPADGSTIYVRLFTKYNPETGLYTWRDYTFTSGP